MCSPIDIKQSSDMEMGGQGKNGFSQRLCLDVGQGLSLPLSIYLSLSLSSSHTFLHFLYLLPSPTTFSLLPSIVPIFAVSPSISPLSFLSFCLSYFLSHCLVGLWTSNSNSPLSSFPPDHILERPTLAAYQ